MSVSVMLIDLVTMVNITAAAQAVVVAYSTLIALGGNYSYPLPTLASQVSSFFLPNYTTFALGEIRVSPNQSVVAERFMEVFTEDRDSGAGTHVLVEKSKVQIVSNESALCWLTFRIFPDPPSIKGWKWTNVYGFRLVEGGLDNGLLGGWEFAIADNEEEQNANK